MLRRQLPAVLAASALFALAPATALAASVEWYGPASDSGQAARIGDAVGGDLATTAPGDFCNVYNAPGDCSDEGGAWTLSFDAGAAPCPHSGAAWCGAQHYVSLAGREGLPWRDAWMQEPALEVSAEVSLDSSGAGASAWAYLCPLLKAPGQPYYLELCIAEWHGPGAGPRSPFASPTGRVASCAPVTAAGAPAAVDTFVLPLAPGAPAPFASALPGSGATQTAPVLARTRFAAQITAAQLRAALAADDLPKNPLHPGAPDEGQGCERGLSPEASGYRLVGIEQGAESLPAARLTVAQAALQASTSFSGAGAEGLAPAAGW